MPLKFTSDWDMFTGEYDVLVNTVNCVGIMGKGIALDFKNRFPEMYKKYKIGCEVGMTPGSIFCWRNPQTRVEVWNVATKNHWRDPSRYEWVRRGLQNMAIISHKKRIAMPPLGCGNGMLDWSAVREMIVLALCGVSADITVFEPR